MAEAPQVLTDLLSSLSGEAQPRPDLYTPGSTGSLENARPYTYAGRVATKPMAPEQLLSKLPQESPDAEGLGTAASLAGAGMISKAQLRAGVRPPVQIAQIAPKGASPVVDFTKLWPAWINEKTGEVRHAMQAILSGWHEPNTPKIMIGKKLVNDPNWTRGHVDPVTWNAFPESRFTGTPQRLTGMDWSAQ